MNDEKRMTLAGGCFILAFAILGASLSGCGLAHRPVEKNAYTVITGAKGFTDSIKAKHPECGMNPQPGIWISTHTTTAPCPVLDKAIAAKDLLIDATEVYCGGPQFTAGGPCQPSPDKNTAAIFAAKLQAAMTVYEQAEGDLKAVIR